MKKLVVLTVWIVAFSVSVSTAVAGDWSDSQLDAAATSVAGHPVDVWCESSWSDWIHVGDEVGYDFGTWMGFTNTNYPTIYISPAICETLHAMLTDEFVGTYHAALAILVLTHESVHQRGIHDEGVADCTALPLVPSMAVDYFGYSATVSQTYLKTVRKRVAVHVGGKTVVRYVTTKRSATRQVVSPFLTDLARDALRWHRSAPAEYQGNC